MGIRDHRDDLYLTMMAASAALSAAALGSRRLLARGSEKQVSGGVAALSAGAAAVLAFGRYVEPRRLVVERVVLPWRGPSLRIGLLTDIHAGWLPGPVLPRAVHALMREKPDLILLGGDYVAHSGASRAALRALAPLGSLRARLGVFAVLGDHDSQSPEMPTPRTGAIVARLGLLGVDVLLNSRRELAPGVALVGLGSARARASKPSGLFGQPGKDLPTIVLCHSFKSLEDPAVGRFDLALAGHTHGGQACLPGTALCPPLEPDMKPFRAGLYPWARGGQLYVSRGLGESVVRARLGSRPEVTLLDLVPRDIILTQQYLRPRTACSSGRNRARRGPRHV